MTRDLPYRPRGLASRLLKYNNFRQNKKATETTTVLLSNTFP